MRGESIDIAAGDGGVYQAYLARPARAPASAVLILPEIFNVTDHIRDVADEYAGNGYLALAPDVYWRTGPGLVLPYGDQGRDRGREIAARTDIGRLVEDLGGAIARLRARPDCTGRVGAVGFCFGGRLAWLLAARQPLDAAVSYYGVDLDHHLDEADAISCPMLLHFAGKDARVPPPVVEAVARRLEGRPNATIHLYPDADHAFNRIGFPRYHPEAAALARERTLRFLARVLAG